MDELIRQRLAEIHPLRTLNPAQWEELLADAELIEPSRGSVLYREGDRDEHSFYLLRGTIRAQASSGADRSIRADSESANYALGNLQPRPSTALAASDDVLVLRADRGRVEAMITRHQVVETEAPSVTVTDLAETSIDGAWVFRMLQSPLFREMPTENVERFLAVIERVEYGPGETVLRQGEHGDYFYMLAEGHCEVLRTVNALEFPIATLEPGASFGEEALIAGKPRNATVRTTSPVVLMRLNQQCFRELFEAPAIRAVSAREAAALIRTGSCALVDVRMESEHGARSIRGSRNVPLYRLRQEVASLPSDQPIVAYCDSGVRSRVAAFLLAQRGLDARYLEGGLSALQGT